MSEASRPRAVNLFDKIAIIFFAFPLLAPAINETVIYPFLLAGLVVFACRRFQKIELSFLLLGTTLIASCVLQDPITGLRIISFYLSCVFFLYVASNRGRLNFLISAGTVHAAAVVLQFTLLLANIEIDFSSILRAIYGPLLPGTGTHIDYNAFSQFDFFFPRVAGINREPAFAAVLFMGLGFIAHQRGRKVSALLFLLATLFSLSKIVLVLIPCYALMVLSMRSPARRSILSIMGRFAIIIVSQLVFYAAVNAASETVSELAALDASFYHRFIGHLMVATDPAAFEMLGSSWEKLSSLPALSDYEFKDFRRGFFDGSVIAKALVDFGWLPALFYVSAISVVSRNWQSALALSIGGLFINLLSVSPATVVTFINLCGMTYLVAAGNALRAPRIKMGSPSTHGVTTHA